MQVWAGLTCAVVMVAGIVHADAPTSVEREHAVDLSVDLGAGVKLELQIIHAGHFTEGSPASEKGRGVDETAHEVTISQDYYLATVPVTRRQFARFVDDTGYKTEAETGKSGGSGWDGSKLVQRKDFNWRTPGFRQTDDDPVTLVTYEDALAFTRWLTNRTARAFTLPTEAQFEYAARGGTTTRFYHGDADPAAIGWFKANAGNATHPVASKLPNKLGLYDMSGNVYQWCLDWYAPYTSSAVTDPMQTTAGGDKPRRVLRGGSWMKDASALRSAARYRNAPGSRNADNGFRVAADTAPVRVVTPAAGTTQSAVPIPPTKVVPAKPSSGPGALLVGILVAVPVLVIGWLVVRRRGRARVGLRPDADGFWIDAPERMRGQLFRYRYRCDGSTVRGSVTLEPAERGQFVYTGSQPTDVVAEMVVAQQLVQSQAQTYRQDDDTSSRAFRGYPSAY